jgi:hypothetical protein
MGSTDDATRADGTEKPQHEVTISRPSHLGRSEVTQQQWKAVMGSTPYSLDRSNPYYDLPGMAERITGRITPRRCRRTTRRPSSTASTRWRTAVATACPPTPSRSTPHAREQPPPTPSATTRVISTVTPGTARTFPRAAPIRSGASCRIREGCTTGTGTRGSGFRTSSTRPTTPSARPSTRPAPTGEPSAWCAAAAGTSRRTTGAAPSDAAARPTTEVSASASAWCGRPTSPRPELTERAPSLRPWIR